MQGGEAFPALEKRKRPKPWLDIGLGAERRRGIEVAVGVWSWMEKARGKPVPPADDGKTVPCSMNDVHGCFRQAFLLARAPSQA